VYVARFFNTVGVRQTGQYGMVIPRFIRQALTNDTITIYGSGEQTRCFCNVRDTVRALRKLPHTPEAAGEIVNLGCTEEVSINELAKRIKKLTGSSSPTVHIPYDEAYESGFEDMNRRVPCIDKAREMLDWMPMIRLDETITEVAEYMR
jgi:UDP-glucose 4-epimerase